MTEDQQDQLVISLDTQYAVAHAIYKLRTRKPVNTIYGCICPNCRHKCILHVDGRSLKKAIRLWNHHASHQRNEQ